MSGSEVVPQVQQHDHEQEEHHDGARVHQDLDDPDEVRTQQRVDRRQAEERHDQPERAGDRALPRHHHERRRRREHAEHEEQDLTQHLNEITGKPMRRCDKELRINELRITNSASRVTEPERLHLVASPNP
jgi:hypothetical protein